jgi:hypothetical protein
LFQVHRIDVVVDGNVLAVHARTGLHPGYRRQHPFNLRLISNTILVSP